MDFQVIFQNWNRIMLFVWILDIISMISSLSMQGSYTGRLGLFFLSFPGIYFTNNFVVSGSPIGCFIGGYLFKQFGSITTYRILSFCAFFTCIIHIMINYLIQRCFTKENIKQIKSCKTQHTDVNVNENLTILWLFI